MLPHQPKILYDYDWLQIVQTTQLVDKQLRINNFNKPSMWKSEATSYHIQVGDKLVSQIAFEDIPAFTKAIDYIINGAQMKAYREDDAFSTISDNSIPSISEPITDTLPHF